MSEFDPRYPIGKYQATGPLSPERRRELIDTISAAPANLRAAVADLDDAGLDTPYREGGWTRRQVVHHMADSHMNAYVRFRLALTEDVPTIKPYNEQAWALLPDAERSPIAPSLAMLDALHERWVLLLHSLAPTDFSRRFRHPELGERTLDETVGLYAWHGLHHVAHVRLGR